MTNTVAHFLSNMLSDLFVSGKHTEEHVDIIPEPTEVQQDVHLSLCYILNAEDPCV